MLLKFNEKYNLSLNDYNILLTLNPNYNSNAYNNRGVARENLKQYEKASVDYQKALEIDPNNELAKNNLRRVLDIMKK